MKTNYRALLQVFSLIASVTIAHASDGFLDPPYHPGVPAEHAVNDVSPDPQSFVSTPDAGLPVKSDTLSVINQMTPVRDQGDRGTCSIFSSTAILEAMLNIDYNLGTDLDLSEEWLEYVLMRPGKSEGSETSANFPALRRYGSANEQEMPYIGETWTNASADLPAQRCGTLHGPDRKACLISHFDPNLLKASDADLDDQQSPLYEPAFAQARTSAFALRDQYLQNIQGPYKLNSLKAVKTLLAQGIPLVLDLNFYDGAWNYKDITGWGIPRSLKAWNQGIVGYPEKGSIDREHYDKAPDGHSVVVVGYDDNVEVQTHQPMTDGTTRALTYQGVFYFKNSWGTDTWGSEAQIDGTATPGYGTITQAYAVEFGEFFQLQLQQ